MKIHWKIYKSHPDGMIQASFWGWNPLDPKLVTFYPMGKLEDLPQEIEKEIRKNLADVQVPCPKRGSFTL